LPPNSSPIRLSLLASAALRAAVEFLHFLFSTTPAPGAPPLLI
jgi:hypothetical protein